MSTHLKQLCHTHLPGNKEDSPAEHFAKMAKWCEENNVNHDVYGEGETIHAFEQKVADLLGYEAGLFCCHWDDDTANGSRNRHKTKA